MYPYQVVLFSKSVSTLAIAYVIVRMDTTKFLPPGSRIVAKIPSYGTTVTTSSARNPKSRLRMLSALVVGERISSSRGVCVHWDPEGCVSTGTLMLAGYYVLYDAIKHAFYTSNDK